MMPSHYSTPTRPRSNAAPKLSICGLLVLCHISAAHSALGQSLFQKRPGMAPSGTTPSGTSPGGIPAGQSPSPPASAEPAPTPSPAVVKSQSRQGPPGGAEPTTPGQSQPGAGQPPDAETSPQPGSGVVMPTLQQEYKSGPMSIRSVSLMAVIPPEPRLHKKHDKIELIVNESSLSTSQQKLDSNKKFDFTAQLSQFPSLAALLGDLELRNGIGTVPPKVGINSDDKFKGDGKYERTDRMTARISGLVSDVKPNGMLLIEARESIQQDEETKTMVISGLCDPKDVTNANTVQSSQLANLTIKIEHGGQVKDSATKGLFPRIFETLFNF